AEDGIRDWSVTGVQTCALPICRWQQRGCGGHATGRRVRCICDADPSLALRAPSLLERPPWFVRNPERKRRVTQWMWAEVPTSKFRIIPGGSFELFLEWPGVARNVL